MTLTEQGLLPDQIEVIIGTEEAETILRCLKDPLLTKTSEVFSVFGDLSEHGIKYANVDCLMRIRRVLMYRHKIYVATGRGRDIRDVFKDIRNYARNAKMKEPDVMIPPDAAAWQKEVAAMQKIFRTTHEKVQPEEDGGSSSESSAESAQEEKGAEGSQPITDSDLRAIRCALRFPGHRVWDGREPEDLISVLQDFKRHLQLAAVPKHARVFALRTILTDSPLYIYEQCIDGRITDYAEAVELLKRCYLPEVIYYNEWCNLKFETFRRASQDDHEALLKLYRRIWLLQEILGPPHNKEIFAVWQLRRAMNDLEAGKSICALDFSTLPQLMSTLRIALENHPTTFSGATDHEGC